MESGFVCGIQKRQLMPLIIPENACPSPNSKYHDTFRPTAMPTGVN